MAIATSAALSLAATAASTGLAVYGQRQAARSAEEAAEYNAQIAEGEATRKEQEDHENTRRRRDEKRRAMAQARAQIAASGVVLGEGSSVDLMQVLDSRLETSIQDASRSAQMEVRAMRQQANLSRYQGSQQASSLKLQSAGTLLGGAAKFGGQYDRAKYRTKPSQKSTLFD